MAQYNTFSVRFNDMDLRRDFKEMIEMFNRKEHQITVKEVNGMYEVIAVDGKEIIWNLAMHKYMSYSKDIMTTPAGTKISRVRFFHASLIQSENAAC